MNVNHKFDAEQWTGEMDSGSQDPADFKAPAAENIMQAPHDAERTKGCRVPDLLWEDAERCFRAVIGEIEAAGDMQRKTAWKLQAWHRRLTWVRWLKQLWRYVEDQHTMALARNVENDRLTAELVALKAEQTKAHELLHDVYDAHRDPQSHESDWNYADKKPVEDAPCAWCDDVKALFDSNPVALKAERATQDESSLRVAAERVVTGDGQQLENLEMDDEAWEASLIKFPDETLEITVGKEAWMALVRALRPLPPPPASSEREQD